MENVRAAGDGTLHYAGELSLDYDARDVGAVQRGIRIEREYLRDSNRQPIGSPIVGDVLAVRLTLYVAQDVHYFTLEETLPAGLEPLDPQLAMTSYQAQAPTLQSQNREDRYWYWGAIYWGRTQIYDTGIRLQVHYLPRGVYTYTYQARAITAGDYRVPPALAHAAQQSDIIGRTAACSMTIASP